MSDNVYLSAEEYIEYTCEQADKIMQMKLGKDYANYIIYDDAGKEMRYSDSSIHSTDGQDIFIEILNAVEQCLADVGIYNEEDRDG